MTHQQKFKPNTDLKRMDQMGQALRYHQSNINDFKNDFKRSA
jgi:hypothetical protein